MARRPPPRTSARPLLPALLPALLLAAGGAGCSSPMEALRRVEGLHDPKTFAHRPDTPATLEACLEGVREVAEAECGDPRDAAGAVFLLSRVATEDPAALHRVHACRGLGRIAESLAAADPWGAEGTGAGPVPGEGETSAALRRLREIHGAGEEATHADDAAVLECAALFRRLAEVRIPLAGDPGPAGFARDLRILRGVLLGVLSESRGESGLPGEGEAEAALRVLGTAAARTALAGSFLHDGDPRVRAEAAGAAAACGGPGVADALRTAYGAERDGSARRALVAAAAVAGARAAGREREPAVALLLAALDDDARGIRFEARAGLRALAGEDLGERPGPWIRWWAEARDRP